jgi:hypothetical protein
MSRKISGSVRLPNGGGLLKEGDERKLAEANLDQAELQRLQQDGVISGFAAEELKDGEELPPIREMKEFLASRPRDEVEKLAASDERTSARVYYEARLAELDESEQA